MAATVMIRDETTGGTTTNEMVLEVLTERITVRELIRSRVFQEVKDYNAKSAQEAQFSGLVQPNDAETALNSHATGKRKIDWQEQFDAAVDAFEQNRVLVLVDDRQVESLEQEIEVRPGVIVSFLKITPLVGG